MMIIERPDQAELQRRNEAIASIEAMLKSANPTNTNGVTQVKATREVSRLQRELTSLKTMRVASESCYLPEQLNVHQTHALKGTRWTPVAKKPDPYGYRIQTNASLGVISIMAPGFVFQGALDGNAAMLIAGVVGVIMALLWIASFIPPIQVAYHNHKIKRTDINGVKMYRMDGGRIISNLRIQLGWTNWSRLRDSLGKDDSPELRRLFVNYYEDANEVQEAIAKTRKSTINTELANQLVLDLDKKFETIAIDTTAEIIAVFNRQDAAAAEDARIASEKAEDARLDQEALAEANGISTNMATLNEVARVIAKSRRI